jgi:hypothetical protein
MLSKFDSIARREIVYLITASIGFFMIFTYYLNIPEAKNVENTILFWNTIFSAFIMSVALVSITRHHYRISRDKSKSKKDNLLSIYFLCVLFLMISLGLVLGINLGAYQFIYEITYINLSALLTAFPGIYLFSATLRAFKYKTNETVVFLIAGIIILFMNAPASTALFPKSPVFDVGSWIINVPTMGLERGFTITAGIAMVVFCIRTLLGVGGRGESG